MRGDLALADEHARELSELAERAGSVNARLLGLVQRFVRLVSEGRADELAGDFAEIVGLIPDEPRSAACAQALLDARRGRLAEARAGLDRVVAGTVPRDGEWLPKYVQVSVAAVLAGHRTAAELAYQRLKPYAGAVLLARPDEQTHVSELTRAAGFPGSDAGPVADRRALAAYRAQLRRIDAELDSVDAGTAEAATLNREREALLAELSATTGLGGRPRVAGSPTERMRKAVTYRIRHAIARVADAHPELGRHLRASVHTGTWCSYTPEHRAAWRQ